MSSKPEHRRRRRFAALAAAVGLGAGFGSCKHGCHAFDEPKAQAEREESSGLGPPSRYVAWKEPVEIATGDAERGPWRMNESRFHYVDDPTVAIGHEERVLVAWVDNQRKDVFFQAYDEAGSARLAEPANVSKSPGIFSWLPRIASDGERVFVLWQEIIFSGGTHGGEILFARSDDGGQHFTDPLNLSNTTAGAGKGRLNGKRWHNGSLDIARAPAGALYAAWTEYQGPLRFARSTDAGRSFSAPLHVAGTGARPARGPSLAVSKDGTIYLAWTVGEDPSADIHVTRSTDAGRSFEPDRLVADTGGHSDAPGIAVDDGGRVHLVYSESPTGPWKRYHVEYTSAAPEARAFQSPKRISGPQQDDQGAAFPSLDIGKSGRLYVLWDHYPDYTDRPRGLGFTVSNDRGQSFETPSLLPGTGSPDLGFNANLQGQLTDKLAVSEAGTVAVVSSRFFPEEKSRIRLILGRAR